MINLSETLNNHHDPFSQQEDDKVEEEFHYMANYLLEEDDEASENDLNMPISAPILIPDEELNRKVELLNQKQRHVFDIVHDWARRHIKNLPSLSPVFIDPLHVFSTGNVGCGKSSLTKLLYQSLTKTFSYRTSELEKRKYLFLAPTGVISINVDGTTINTAVQIPVGYFEKILPSLNDKMRSMSSLCCL